MWSRVENPSSPQKASSQKVSCFVGQSCGEQKYTIEECWDRGGYPVCDDVFPRPADAKAECKRHAAVSDVQWFGGPSQTGTYVSQPVQLGTSQAVRRSILDECRPDGDPQKCEKAQRRRVRRQQPGCVTPALTQFTPAYPQQEELLRAPLCVGAVTWEYRSSPKDEPRSGLTLAACLAKDTCQSCPCDDDTPCYDKTTKKCRRKEADKCPNGTVDRGLCTSGGRDQEACAEFDTQLECPSAKECMSGENALMAQVVP